MGHFRQFWTVMGHAFLDMLEHSYISVAGFLILLMLSVLFVPVKVSRRKRVTIGLLHVAAHLTAAMILMLLLELGIETCVRHQLLGSTGKHTKVKGDGNITSFRAKTKKQKKNEKQQTKQVLERFSFEFWVLKLEWELWLWLDNYVLNVMTMIWQAITLCTIGITPRKTNIFLIRRGCELGSSTGRWASTRRAWSISWLRLIYPRYWNRSLLSFFHSSSHRLCRCNSVELTELALELLVCWWPPLIAFLGDVNKSQIHFQF